MSASFRLDPSFVSKYRTRPAPFGFSGLGEVVYLRTYSRVKSDGSKETWTDTVERVINGTYNMQKEWIDQHSLGWDNDKGQESAQEMFDRMWNMKFLPPGRGLWAQGSSLTEDRRLYAALNNCAFVSTEHIDKDLTKPFCFLMDMSMLGCGVGFDTKGAGKIFLNRPNPNKVDTFVIPDSREGWVESLKLLLESYFIKGKNKVELDYSLVRKAGEPIKGFGGVSSGPGPLKDLHTRIVETLDKEIGKPISVTSIADICNLTACCVVSGNVRRSALIALGDPDSEEFTNLKNYNVNPHRAAYGWSSNNSVYAEIGTDYSKFEENVRLNGEPGFAWLDNMRYYGRMNGVHDSRDSKAMGTNPCVTADTLILTDRGQVPVRDLINTQFNAVVNGIVYSSTNRGFWRTGVNTAVLRVTLANGNFVRCTANHLILLRGEIWKEAGRLQVGDQVACNNNEYSPVVCIYSDGIEDVYDATVPEISRFVANNIIVHNCVEQTLESYEVCNLVECFPNRCEDLNDFLRTLKFAYLYSKTVSLGKTHWPETNRILLRNRRIGCSLSGIAQFLARHSLEELRVWCEEGYDTIQKYDNIYSEWLCIPKSIKTTSIKPSGTVSLLAGATPGVHYPQSRYYIRRMRLSAQSELIEGLKAAGFHIEPDVYSPGTLVVEFPVDCGEGIRTIDDVSMWEQLSLVSFIQRHYADNQVSATITFDPDTEGKQIAHALNFFQYQLKGISFLPKMKEGAYPQMPYERIDAEKYDELISKLKPLRLTDKDDSTMERFCDGESCILSTGK